MEKIAGIAGNSGRGKKIGRISKQHKKHCMHQFITKVLGMIKSENDKISLEGHELYGIPYGECIKAYFPQTSKRITISKAGHQNAVKKLHP